LLIMVSVSFSSCLPHGIIVLPNGIKVQRSGDQDPVVFGRRAFTGAVGPGL
jgi:hypothetical protein